MLSMLQEKRPLKRTRLGPPDIYPQDAELPVSWIWTPVLYCIF